MQSLTFGTSPDCDVQVRNDPYISPHHCRVFRTPWGTANVEDLGSTNGTWIRWHTEAPIMAHRVRPGTPMAISPGWVIRIGRTDIPWRQA